MIINKLSIKRKSTMYIWFVKFKRKKNTRNFSFVGPRLVGIRVKSPTPVHSLSNWLIDDV